MPSPHMQSPPGYNELCAKLQTETNPAKFRVLVEQINRLLREHERLAGSPAIPQFKSLEPGLEVLVSL